MVRKFFWIVILFIITSCQSHQDCPSGSDAFLNDYHQLMQDVSKLDRYISTREWQPYDRRFEQLIIQCYPEIQPELTDSLDRAVWLDAITFAMNRHRYDVQKIIQDTTDQTLIVIRDHMRKLWDNPYSAFEEIFRRQTGQEFMDALKEVKKDSTSQ